MHPLIVLAKQSANHNWFIKIFVRSVTVSLIRQLTMCAFKKFFIRLTCIIVQTVTLARLCSKVLISWQDAALINNELRVGKFETALIF